MERASPDVAPPQVGQLGPPLLHRGQPLRVTLDVLGDRAQLVGDVGQVGLHRPQAGDDRRERRPLAELGQGGGHPVASAALGAEGRVGRAAGLSMGVGVAEDGLLGEEPLVLAVIGEPGGLDLVELEAQEVALAIAGRRVASQRARAPRRRPAGPRRAASRSCRSTPAKRSSARRWLAVVSNPTWACWPWRSTRPAASSESSAAVIRRPSR